ncbi:hypothetical protein RVR_2972 [Actinacidiphila reveromycinica]|uniref:DNA-binding protein n=1 Tax=Actinacidiphila reveromycinica TaxID=659352 RepID=A0A7U3URC7_9ACTN|nr:hypothetical protein [Streptomyces sp. SN-593]BBA97300.1 hypothetical protein RVR_2972 [Streptomyces sp. SN-593]
MNDGDLLAAGAVLPLDGQPGTGAGTRQGSGRAPASGAAPTSGAAPASGGERPGGTTDVLVARAYAHPVLDGRTVVRLVPEALGEAEDLSLEYLGFAPGFAAEADAAETTAADAGDGAQPADDGASADAGDGTAGTGTAGEPAAAGTAVPVGRVLRQSLGFPAWALVHDPANARHALAVVKEMERLTRLAATRPGHAKDGFSEIGERLDRSVPHFLPTYYEEVARIFLAAESTGYASSYFGKAREAERRHALEIDEERLREVFLEFASAGALSGKTLREQARGLSERLSPETAFTQFRLLCVERATAGLPPHAGLVEDLRRLAKAAGLDAPAEEASLVGELLGTSAIDRAGVSFWKSARTALLTAARDSRAARARLLRLFPAEATNMSDGRAAIDTMWLELLEHSGAFALLAEGPGRPPGADAPDPRGRAATGAETGAGKGAGAEAEADADVPGAAWWFGQWAQFRRRGYRRREERLAAELELVERFAPQLAREGVRVRLTAERGHREVSPDLLDVCLAAGVPVADPHDGVVIDLADWLADDRPGRRDLAAVAADPRFAPLLRSGVEQAASRADGTENLRTLAAHPVLSAAVAGWLADRADDLDRPLGLPLLDRQLSRLAQFGDPRVLATAPAAVDRLTSFDVAPVLARTLRAGVMDELGWPALDAYVARHLDLTAGGQWFELDDAWPALIVAHGTHVAAVGPDAVLDERTLPLPAPNPYSWMRPTVRFVDGQWLIVSGYGDERRAAWSGRPADTFRPGGDPSSPYRGSGSVSLALAGGGRWFGSRPVLPGDTSFAARRPVASDGISHWVLYERHWHEYDPAGAVRGRASLPAFFDSALAEDGAGTRLEESSSYLLPLQPGLEGTPFGSKDGMLGWWVRRDEATATCTAGSVDGSRSPATSGGATPLPPLRLPGGAALHPTVRGSWTQTVTLYGADGVEWGSVDTYGRGGHFASGTDLVPPLWYWHALRPRDEAGSALLRDVTDAQAAALLAAVPDEKSDAAAAVREVLPGISDPRLVKGVASVVGMAAAAARRIALLGERRSRPAQDPSATAEHAGDTVLGEAMRGLIDPVHVGGYPGGGANRQTFTAMDTLRTLNAVTAGTRPERPAPPAEKDGRFPFGDTYHRRRSIDWLTLAGAGVTAAVARAAAPGTPAEQRAALLEFLRTALGLDAEGVNGDGATGAQGTGASVLADPRGRLRLVDITGKKAPNRIGQVMCSGGRSLLVVAFWRDEDQDEEQTWKAVEFAPDGRFGAWEGFTLVEDRVLGTPAPAGPGGTPAESAATAALLAGIAARGPVPYRPEAAARFAERTGADVSLAALLLLGLPGLGGYGKWGLPPAEVLELAELRPNRALTARDALRRLTTADRVRLLAALVPADPSAVDRLWTDGFDPDALADAWLSVRGGRRPVPIELVERAEREGDFGGWIETVVNSEADPALVGRTRQRLDADGHLCADDPRAVLDGNELWRYTGALRWLAYRLPYGHPLRPSLRDTLAALRARLADENLLLDPNLTWSSEGKPVAPALREAYGLPETGGEDADGLVRVGPAIVLTPSRRGAKYEDVWLRSAAVVPGASPEGGPDHPALVLLAGFGGPSNPYTQALRDVLGEDLAAAVAADGPAGAAQDPTHSVPELTEQVARHLGLSPDAAALYLMLLALPDPTDRNVTVWTGWKPARTKRARAELAGTDLVVEAKRARAGRSLFLPGGWLEAKAPALPMESWKQPLFRAGQLEITAQPIPELPVPELFRRAWQRVLDGDPPAFEEFVQRRTGRGRR